MPPSVVTIPPYAAGTYIFSTAPYVVPPPAPVPVVNPNYPSPVPAHDNVIRHWANMTQDNPVPVVIACPYPDLTAPPPNNSTLDVFGGANGAGAYSWETWMADIEATFAKFRGVPTAAVWATTTRVYTNTASPPVNSLGVPYNSATLYGIYDPPPPEFCRRHHRLRSRSAGSVVS